MPGKSAATLLLVLAAALGSHAETLSLREHLVAGSRLRYAVRLEHQLTVDYSRRLAAAVRGQNIQRKYELTGVVAISVAEAGADGRVRLAANFEELRLSRWYWGEDRAQAEQMVAALRRQQMSVTRDAAGNVNLVPAQPILLERFRQDVASLESLAVLPLLELGSVPLALRTRASREIPPERYRYRGQPAPAAATQSYQYVGDRTVADRGCALLATETVMPLPTLDLPGVSVAREQQAQPGTSLRTSGEARSDKLVLVEPEQGLLLATREHASVYFRLTGRSELGELQARIPVALATLRFTGQREARWLGPGDEQLLAEVRALPTLDELRDGRSPAGRRAEPSLGEVARELRAERKSDSPASPPPPAERPRQVEERELVRFPVDQPLDAASLRVRFDRSRSVDGNGSVLVLADEPVVVSLYTVEALPLQNAQLVYQAWLRTEYVTGQAYLEMWCTFDGLGEFYSRGLAQAVTGSHGWVRVETPFYLGPGQTPSRIQLNLVVNGRGRVWIDDIRLLARPPR